MPNYSYKVRDRSGKLITGAMDSDNKESLAKRLEGMGYIPIVIEEARDLGLQKFTGLFKNVKPEEVNIFTRQLLTLQTAGLPILTSLVSIEVQIKNRYFKDAMTNIISSVETGTSLSSALEKYPKIFSEIYVNMIRAGEAGGVLDDILKKLAELGESDLDTRNRIKSATRYPMIASCALAAAFIVMMVFVIPKFAAIFAHFKTELPLPTRVMIGLSGFLKARWYLLILIAAGSVFLFKYLVRTKKGRLALDGIKLNAPAIGPIMTMLTMSRLTRIMSLMMASGLPILQVLDIAARTIDNEVVSDAMRNVMNSVREGKGLSEPMRLSRIFPPIVVQMVAVGEQTGKVDELLAKVSDYYDQQSDYSIKNMTVLIEPLFVLFLGVMVLVMALGIFLPMWSVGTLFK